MLSKFVQKPATVVRPQDMLPQPKRAVRRRATRSHGGFLYRGIAFTYVNKGDLVILHTWNDNTNSPNPGVIVPKEKKRLAMAALARIILAEKEIEDMGGVSPESGPGNA